MKRNKKIVIKLEDLKKIIKDFENEEMVSQTIFYYNGLKLEVLK